MKNIFISHSKSDKETKVFFRRTITEKVGLKPTLMEYEDWTHENAGIEIKNKIMSERCKCLIVLIGKRILFPEGYNYSFTHNWVGFEIGLATSRGIPVVVFEEDSMEFNEIVEFPVPLVGHYFRYKRNQANSKYIGEVLKRLTLTIPYLNYLYSMPFKVKCSWDHCNAEYLYWNLRQWTPGKEITPCPVRRGHFRPGVNEKLTRDRNSHRFFPAVS